MTAQDCCVIVPTIRNFACLRSYFANARQHGFDVGRLHFVMLTEDFGDKAAMKAMLREQGVSGEVFNETDRLRWLRDLRIESYADLLPRRSHAETSFGLLYMWANQPLAFGWFIDDDTSPVSGQDFFGSHLRNLQFRGPVDALSSDKRWVNVLFRTFQRDGLYPRGYPYGARKEKLKVRRGTANEVVASQGLWTNVPDLDAIRLLSEGALDGVAITRTADSDYGDPFVVDSRNYLTVSSMNLAFRREVIPAFYQFPMDDNRWEIGRYDDIWSGVILKRACDVLGKSIMTGRPLCVHNKAPRNVFRDLNAEVPALELNEHLWEVVDSVGETGSSYAEICLEIASALRAVRVPWINADFLTLLARCLERWIDCLTTIDRKSWGSSESSKRRPTNGR